MILKVFYFVSGQKSIDNIAAKQQRNQVSNDSFVFSRFMQRFVQNLRNEIEKNNSKFKWISWDFQCLKVIVCWSYCSCLKITLKNASGSIKVVIEDGKSSLYGWGKRT